MKIKDILEGTVVTGDFGRGKIDVSNDIDIPKGYKSFHVRPSKTGKVGTIVGVTADGKEKDLGTSNIELADTLCKAYNSGGKSGSPIKKIQLKDIGSSDGFRVVSDLGYEWHEKPDYFETVRAERPLFALDLKKIERAFDKAGIKLVEYEAARVFEKIPDEEDAGTSRDVKPGLPSTIIIKFPSGNRYLVDRTGATKYFRMWLAIKDR